MSNYEENEEPTAPIPKCKFTTSVIVAIGLLLLCEAAIVLSFFCNWQTMTLNMEPTLTYKLYQSPFQMTLAMINGTDPEVELKATGLTDTFSGLKEQRALWNCICLFTIAIFLLIVGLKWMMARSIIPYMQRMKSDRSSEPLSIYNPTIPVFFAALFLISVNAILLTIFLKVNICPASVDELFPPNKATPTYGDETLDFGIGFYFACAAPIIIFLFSFVVLYMFTFLRRLAGASPRGYNAATTYVPLSQW